MAARLQFARRSRRTAVGVVALATALVVVGCGTKVRGNSGSAATPGSGSSRASTPATPSVGASASVGDDGCDGATSGETLTYWSADAVGTPVQKLFAQILSDFTAQCHVKVDVKWLGKNAVQTAENAIATGGGPDMIDTNYSNAGGLRQRGIVPSSYDQVLSEQVPGTGKTVSQLTPAIYQKASSDSQGLVYIPVYVTSSGIWFDKATHPELASSPPKTWSDFVTTMATYKAKGLVPVAEEGAQSSYNLYWLFSLLMRYGGPGSMAALGTSVGAWDNPAVLKSAQAIAQLVEAGDFQPGYMGSVYPNAQNQWREGKMVTELNGTWLATETQPVAPANSQPSIFPFPSVPNGHNQAQYISTQGWAINAKSAHPQAAQQFIAFALQPKYVAKIATDTLNIPAEAGASAPPALQAIQQALLSATEFSQTWDGLPVVAPTMFTSILPALNDELIAGKITPEQFVSEGKTKTSSYLKSGSK